ncbi:MAG: GDP-mannose 4,6-dehydratase, partial [Methylophaga sp.]|nr:GDP-mannose 4,6-dehydratase [Methylophaga sp.]
LETVGLRYFNVFGPKQDPNGTYAAVIPKFIARFLNKEDMTINGDGEHSRDFTYIENVIQANIKALLTDNKKGINQVYNVAFGENSSLNQLVKVIKKELDECGLNTDSSKVHYGPQRQGDVKHSLANILKANKLLEYKPEVSFEEGIKRLVKYSTKLKEKKK